MYLNDRKLRNDLKLSNRIMDHLDDLGYAVNSESDAVDIIEKHAIDMSGFQFPYGAKNVKDYVNIVRKNDIQVQKILARSRNTHGPETL